MGKLKNHQVKLHVDTSIYPVATPARPVPYHPKARVTKEIERIIKQDVIDKHPVTQPAPWASNVVIARKADGAIRMTLDASNVNKTIQSSNLPIPRQEDIKDKQSGATVFSKMDLATGAAPRPAISDSFPRKRQAIAIQTSHHGRQACKRRTKHGSSITVRQHPPSKSHS